MYSRESQLEERLLTNQKPATYYAGKVFPNNWNSKCLQQTIQQQATEHELLAEIRLQKHLNKECICKIKFYLYTTYKKE